jgi:hypothetical protein
VNINKKGRKKKVKQKREGKINNLADFIKEFTSEEEDALLIGRNIIKYQREVDKSNLPGYVECPMNEMEKYLKLQLDVERTKEISKHLKGCGTCFRKAKELLTNPNKGKKSKKKRVLI